MIKAFPRKRSSTLILVVMIFAGCGDTVTDTHETATTQSKTFTPDQAAPFVHLALDCAVQEYPNKIAHTMQSDADQGTPRSLHPSFYGCFDWHSSVHGHWLLARFARLYPGARTGRRSSCGSGRKSDQG